MSQRHTSNPKGSSSFSNETIDPEDYGLGLPASMAPANSTASQATYYQEYKRVLSIQFDIGKQLNAHRSFKAQIVGKIAELEKSMELRITAQDAKARREDAVKRRNRRVAAEVDRKFKCRHAFCQKQYGSEGSLLQHIRLKHGDDEPYV